MSNYDFWHGDEIWKGKTLPFPLSREEFKGEGQGTPTPAEWVAFGEATGFSPERGRKAFSSVVPNNPYMDMGVLGARITGRMLGGERLVTDQERDKTLRETMNSMPVVRRFAHLTHPAENEMLRTEDITDEAYAEKIRSNRNYDEQYNEFLRGRKTLDQVHKWIASQPIEHRKRLANRHKKGVAIDMAFKSSKGESVLSSITWLNWMNQPADVRAELFYKEYIGKGPEDRKRMLTMGQKINGFWEGDFSRYFARLINQQGREQH